MNEKINCHFHLQTNTHTVDKKVSVSAEENIFNVVRTLFFDDGMDVKVLLKEYEIVVGDVRVCRDYNVGEIVGGDVCDGNVGGDVRVRRDYIVDGDEDMGDGNGCDDKNVHTKCSTDDDTDKDWVGVGFTDQGVTKGTYTHRDELQRNGRVSRGANGSEEENGKMSGTNDASKVYCCAFDRKANKFCADTHEIRAGACPAADIARDIGPCTDLGAQKARGSTRSASNTAVSDTSVKNFLISVPHQNDVLKVKIRQKSAQAPPTKKGFANLGNTCYMNSALQCMVDLPLLTTFIRTNTFKGRLTNAYRDLLTEYAGDSRVIVPAEFRKCVVECTKRFYGCKEQDASEFLICVIERMCEEMKCDESAERVNSTVECGVESMRMHANEFNLFRKKNDNIFTALFFSWLSSSLTCQTCRNMKEKGEAFLSLELPIPNEMSCHPSVILTFKERRELIGGKLCVRRRAGREEAHDDEPVRGGTHRRDGTPYKNVPINGRNATKGRTFVKSIKIFVESSLTVKDLLTRTAHKYKTANLVAIANAKAFAVLKDSDLISHHKEIFVFEYDPAKEYVWIRLSVCSFVFYTCEIDVPFLVEVRKCDNGMIEGLFGEIMCYVDEENCYGGDGTCRNGACRECTNERGVSGGERKDEERDENNNVIGSSARDLNGADQNGADPSVASLTANPVINPAADHSSAAQQIGDKFKKIYEYFTINFSPMNKLKIENTMFPLASAHIKEKRLIKLIGKNYNLRHKIYNERRGTIKLEDCIDLFLSKEYLGLDNRLVCTHCDRITVHSKKYEIVFLPKYLIIQLKRFNFNGDYQRKIKTFVDFQSILVINAVRYRLRSTCNHVEIGIGSGHYMAYFYGDRMVCANDSVVSDVKDVSKGNAYVLFYERVE